MTKKTESGDVLPKFSFLTVSYSPPGTAGGHTATTVTYTGTSVLGYKLVESRNSNQNLDLTATASAGAAGNGVSISVGLSKATADGSDHSLDVKWTTTNGLTDPAPSGDGINHDLDLIYIWLNSTRPIVHSWTERSSDGEIPVKVPNSDQFSWTVAAANGGLNFMYVQAGWLRSPATMPPTVATQLAAYGITQGDYPTILSADPLATGTPIRGNSRYLSTGEIIPYEPPSTASDPAPVTSFDLKSDYVYSAGTNTSTETSTSVTVDAKASVAFIEADLKLGGKWTDTYKSSAESSEGYTADAALKLAGPSLNYTGPVQVEVFWDTLFHTFAFDLYAPTTQAVAQGSVLDQQGKPVAFAPVSMVVDGVTRRTYTDRSGVYKIYGFPQGRPGTLAFQGGTKAVVTGQAALGANLVVQRSSQ